jgi:DNA-binding NarL/FixJ family response regulator
VTLTSLVRVLVVDDFEPFRRIVSSMVRERTELQLVGEAADGLEAVEQTQKLLPDLILLDIALPRMNGIEAARRILRLAPESKIIFLSQDSSAELAQEALRLGARGYVIKTDAGAELFSAVEAVLEGRKYVSNGLAQHVATDAAKA